MNWQAERPAQNVRQEMNEIGTVIKGWARVYEYTEDDEYILNDSGEAAHRQYSGVFVLTGRSAWVGVDLNSGVIWHADALTDFDSYEVLYIPSRGVLS